MQDGQGGYRDTDTVYCCILIFLFTRKRAKRGHSTDNRAMLEEGLGRKDGRMGMPQASRVLVAQAELGNYGNLLLLTRQHPSTPSPSS
jgi:hypothetical protein